MAKKNDGGFAFPCLNSTHYPQGMTLRQWYAGMALQGILAGHDLLTREEAIAASLAAELSLDYANAMIEAENEQEKE